MAAKLSDGIPAGWGFTALIFEVAVDGPAVFYISSDTLEVNVRTLREFLQRLEGQVGG